MTPERLKVGDYVRVPTEGNQIVRVIEADYEFGLVGVQRPDGSRKWGCIEDVVLHKPGDQPEH